MEYNPIIDSDYYKLSHRNLYAPNTTGLFSYAESRGGSYDTGILFSLQGYLLDKLTKPVTKDQVDLADEVLRPMGPAWDRKPWDDLIAKHGGFMPLRIKAVKEGQKVPVKNAIVTVENTDPEFFWLTSFVETPLIRLWYGTTIATKAYHMRKNIDALYKDYCESGASSDFSLLDFGCRGVSSYETAAIGGAAFLTSFVGSDTNPGIHFARRFYNAGDTAGYSVKATEHSVMCSYGSTNEFESFKHILNTCNEGDIISVVSDTWNIFKACEMWNQLSELVYKKNLSLVVRPDSGEPTDVLPKVLDILRDGYKTTKNSKGLRVFQNVKVLWGDGISEANYLDVLKIPVKSGWSPENIMLGSGGGLLQNVNRDTMKFAFKASAREHNYKNWEPIAKAPITDLGKKSKKGRLALIISKEDGKYKTVDETLAAQLGKPQLELVYENGEVKRHQSFEEIRKLVRE